MKNKIILIAALILIIGGFLLWKNSGNEPSPTPVITQPENMGFLKLPSGFQISRFAEDLTDPRVIIFDPKGRMLVSETSAGRVIMLLDKDGDGKSEDKKVILDGLESPHGLAFYIDSKTDKTYLYIAQIKEVKRYVYNVDKGELVETDGENIVDLPTGGRHFTRTIAFGPNYQTQAILNTMQSQTMSPIKLYVSVGSSCDTCIESSWKYGAILESDPDGNYTAELAGGLRNSVFFAFHPETDQMWATEMGRDGLDDDLPPDEINIIKPNTKYGWPFCYGKQVKDKSFKPEKVNRTDIPEDCSLTQPPVIEIPAHSAPLGLAFITSDKWPKEWQDNLLVAYHGSTQSNTLKGYKIVRFQVNRNGGVSGQDDFITGWLADGPSAGSGQAKIYGRPVDLKFGPDGALYVSDDEAGMIYRVEPLTR